MQEEQRGEGEGQMGSHQDEEQKSRAQTLDSGFQEPDHSKMSKASGSRGVCKQLPARQSFPFI